MREEDRKAIYDLMAEMEWLEALEFFRAETGDGLRAANFVAGIIASEEPDSCLARSRVRP